jgi:Pyruvate/2-oxoacid:ferredoxin oxidoreductase delta subunit
MERSDPASVDTGRGLGLAFPVACNSTYPLVWRFLEGLPAAGGTRVFMVDTLAGSSGGIVGPLKKLLLRKGYQPVGAAEIRMPCNIFYVAGDALNQRLVQDGLAAAGRFAADLLAGTAQWGRVPVASDLMEGISRGVLRLWRWQPSQRLFRFRVDADRCTECGLCARLCPVRNIQMQGSPEFGLKCQYCMRCVSFCPAQAIRSRLHWGGRTWRAVEAKDLIGG